MTEKWPSQWEAYQTSSKLAKEIQWKEYNEKEYQRLKRAVDVRKPEIKMARHLRNQSMGVSSYQSEGESWGRKPSHPAGFVVFFFFSFERSETDATV
jgi:hypothetical protein